MLPRLQEHFGVDSLGERAATFLTCQLTRSSYESYGSHLRMFASFCAEEGIYDILDATTTSIVRYLAWLGDRGTVKYSSLQPYLSAINKYFADHGKEPVALGSLIESARRGFKQQQLALDEPTIRIPVPATAALSILRYAESLATTPLHPDFRGAVAVLTNFAFCCRAGTGVHALHGDLAVDNNYITLYKRVLKGHKAGELTSAAQIPCSGLLTRLAVLLTVFFLAQNAAFSQHSSELTYLWELPTDSSPASWTSQTLSSWLQSCCVAVGVSAPPGFSYSSHSLRSGAASAANAVGASLPHIRWLGNWAKDSDVVHDYISPAILFTQAAFSFFGWLTPSAHLRGLASGLAPAPGKRELP